MPCTRLTAKKYKNRPGPPYHAGDCKGQTLPGNNGRYFTSVPTAKGVYRWKPSGSVGTLKSKKSNGIKTYLTLDNGNHPYQVSVDNKQNKISAEFRIFDYTDYDTSKFLEEPKLKSVKQVYSPHSFKQVWIAKGIDSFTNRVDPEFVGNSVLAQLTASHCVLVGANITEFYIVPGDSLESATFTSDVGSNAVPYPYLVGATHTYFLLDFVAVPNEQFNFKAGDLYSQFYGFSPGADGKEKGRKRLAEKLKIKKIHMSR
jgi:hypothetical protein